MQNLILSLLLLLFSPLLFFALGKKYVGGFLVLNKVVSFLLIGLVLFQMVPELIEHDQIAISIFCVLLGFFIPSFAEKKYSRYNMQIHTAASLVAIFGLIFHSLFDGISLAYVGIESDVHHHHVHPILWFLIFHQLVVGIFIFAYLLPHWGWKKSYVFLLIQALTIALGFIGGDWLIANLLDYSSLNLLQAFMMGTLLHIAFEKHLHGDSEFSAHEHGEHCSHDHS